MDGLARTGGRIPLMGTVLALLIAAVALLVYGPASAAEANEGPFYFCRFEHTTIKNGQPYTTVDQFGRSTTVNPVGLQHTITKLYAPDGTRVSGAWSDKGHVGGSGWGWTKCNDRADELSYAEGLKQRPTPTPMPAPTPTPTPIVCPSPVTDAHMRASEQRLNRAIDDAYAGRRSWESVDRLFDQHDRLYARYEDYNSCVWLRDKG